MRELFLSKELMRAARRCAVSMLSSGLEQRNTTEITDGDLPKGPKFIVATESDDLMVLSTFTVDGIEFHLGCRR